LQTCLICEDDYLRSTCILRYRHWALTVQVELKKLQHLINTVFVILSFILSLVTLETCFSKVYRIKYHTHIYVFGWLFIERAIVKCKIHEITLQEILAT
jgi:hypothetical protein